MENNEKLDWKPEVGKTAWAMMGRRIREYSILPARFADEFECFNEEVGISYISEKYLFPTHEAALASIKIYDLEGKEVLIPRAQDEIAMLKTELVVANAIIDNLSPRLEAALEMILELQDEKEQWEFERGGAANGGKSDQREGGC